MLTHAPKTSAVISFFLIFIFSFLLLLVVRCFIRHAPHWVPDLFNFYTGIKQASTIFINYFVLSFTMFRPMRTLLDAHLGRHLHGRNPGVNFFYHFF